MSDPTPRGFLVSRCSKEDRAMNEEKRTVWERYVASWKAVSAEEKRALFARCVAERCTYTDPLVRTTGWDATEQFLAHHGASVARWRMLNAAEVPVGEGISYAEYDDEGRLMRMTGFFETPAEPL
jgi:hypothetical protein